MQLPDAIPELRTERLSLRPLRADDADTVARLSDDTHLRRSTRFLPEEPSIEAASRWIESVTRTASGRSAFTWAITETERGVVYGVVGIEIDRGRETGRLECWIGEPFRGQGIATEACRAVIRTVFEEWALHRVEGSHLMREQASGRLAERLGLLPEGVRRQAERWHRHYEDIAHYGLLRSDFIR